VLFKWNLVDKVSPAFAETGVRKLVGNDLALQAKVSIEADEKAVQPPDKIC
jgi:hypothetical protein